jgi:hypothetical protein
MNRKQYRRYVVLFATLLCLVPVVAYGQRADKKAKQEFVFKGKVVKVDANAKTVTVLNDYIPGWTQSVSGTYTVDNPEVLKTLEPGDRVTAKVYEGNFKVLYELKLVPPDDLPAQLPGKKYKE